VYWTMHTGQNIHKGVRDRMVHFSSEVAGTRCRTAIDAYFEEGLEEAGACRLLVKDRSDRNSVGRSVRRGRGLRLAMNFRDGLV